MKSIQLGTTEIAGYRLMEFIGAGGMGNVYKAYHAALQREAAIKILHQQQMADRFRNEAYIQSSVNHPGIARLYEYLPQGNMPCIIMEYVHGQTLDSFLQSRGKLNSDEAEAIAGQVAAALAYLHTKDIVHRDIKPANFKVQPDGIVKMLDFGISKNKYSPKLTQLGFVVGTTAYMAPEQFHQQVEKKSDCWSLGIMTYELLTGYLPFDDPNQVSLRAKILKGDYTKPSILVPGISTALNTLVEKTLRVNASSRITAQQAATLLASTSSATPLAAARSVLFSKQRLLAAGFILVAFILLMAFISKLTTGVEKRPDYSGGDSLSDIQLPDSREKRIKINTPSVENANIVFKDGNSKALPCEISGKRGDNIEFTIRASGYADKKVQVEITDRRSSYEYNLEKIKE